MRVVNFLSYCKGTTKIKLVEQNTNKIFYTDNDANNFFNSEEPNYESMFKDKEITCISVDSDGTLLLHFRSANSSEFQEHVDAIKGKFDELCETLDRMIQEIC